LVNENPQIQKMLHQAATTNDDDDDADAETCESGRDELLDDNHELSSP
jgi:hypothetical protein